MDVSVIIVNYNTKGVLENCLKSVYAQTREIEFEVIVVDNASADGSCEMIRREFPQVRLIENKTNRGFAGGNNEGMKAARGGYFLLLNPDTVILEGAIQKTFRYAQGRPDAAVVGCKVLSGDGTLQDTCSTFPSLINLLFSATGLSGAFPRSRLFGRHMMTWWDRNDTREVDAVAGCFMLVRREAVEGAGMMDERYFMYAEETDWCYRFARAGYRTVFFHEARIIHLIGQSAKTAARDMNLERRKSLLAFFRKHRGVSAAWAANILFVIGDAVRVIGWSVAEWIGKLRGTPNAARRGRIAGRIMTLKWHLAGIENDGGAARKATIAEVARQSLQAVVSICYVGLVAVPRRMLFRIIGRPRRELVVLGYHGVKDFQRAGFAWQMDELLRAGRPVALGSAGLEAVPSFRSIQKLGTVPSFGRAESLEKGRFGEEPSAPEKLGTVPSFRGIAVTFDDAFENIMKNALPELESRGVPCVIFAPAGSIGGLPGWKMREGSTNTAEPVMSAEELKRVMARNVTIGSHGVRHIRIGRLGDEEAKTELAESKRTLEDGLGAPVDLIAFPHGDWTKRTVELAQEAGYKRAFSIEPKIEAADSEKFLLGRFLVEPDDWAIEFWLKLRGGYEWMVPIRWLGKRVRRMIGHVPKTGMPEGEAVKSGK